MTTAELKSRLHGVLGFPITPFRSDLSLDPGGLERNVAAMSAHPFCAIVAAGGAGEIYSLAVEEIVEVVHVAARAVAGRAPLVAGVGFNVAMAAELARRCERAGADALLVLPPYYANAPEAGMLDYYRAIGNASGLPLIAYTRDWAAFTPEMAARLADSVPTLAAWKDGQGDARRFQRIMSRVGDRLAWLGGAGDDCVPAYSAIGVQGHTSSISNISPKLSLALGAAAQARDFAKLDELMRKFVHPLFAIRERARGYEVAVVKKAMEILGMPAGPVRPPLVNCAGQDVEDIRRLMEEYAAVSD